MVVCRLTCVLAVAGDMNSVSAISMLEAVRAGASGFVLKDTLFDDLLAAVRIVAGGQALLAPSVTRRLVEEFVRRGPAPPLEAQPSVDTLTEREREVLIAVARGLGAPGSPGCGGPRWGFVFQAFNLLPQLTAEENVTLPLDLAGRRPDRAWVDLVVETLGLQDRPAHKPAELSGGQHVESPRRAEA